MINKLKNNKLFNQILKFGVVGGIAFVIDYITLIVCKEIFNINVLLSAAIAFTVSVIFNYILSIKWVFDVNKKQTYREVMVFIILSAIGLGVNQVCMYIGADILKIHYMIVKIGATAIVMVYNFITRKIFVEK